MKTQTIVLSARGSTNIYCALFYSKANGEFQAPGIAKPNDLAAVQLSPGSPDWILAKVIAHDASTGMCRLADEDIESNKSENMSQLPGNTTLSYSNTNFHML